MRALVLGKPLPPGSPEKPRPQPFFPTAAQEASARWGIFVPLTLTLTLTLTLSWSYVACFPMLSVSPCDLECDPTGSRWKRTWPCGEGTWGLSLYTETDLIPLPIFWTVSLFQFLLSSILNSFSFLSSQRKWNSYLVGIGTIAGFWHVDPHVSSRSAQSVQE